VASAKGAPPPVPIVTTLLTPAGVADSDPAPHPGCTTGGDWNPVAARLRRLPPANIRNASGVLAPDFAGNGHGSKAEVVVTIEKPQLSPEESSGGHTALPALLTRDGEGCWQRSLVVGRYVSPIGSAVIDGGLLSASICVICG